MRRSLLALLCLVAAACASSSSAPKPAPSDAPRVVLISLDGFRADYLFRPGAKNLRALAARGVRAERMIPAFPSKTFPNHYSIVTGLTPEHHGIVANAMRDPVLGLFTTRDRAAQQDSRWWSGEPIWITAEKQGRRAAALFWPGSEAPIQGRRASWWTPYEHERPNDSRVRQVLQWLALPADSAPALIATYFSNTDDDGHNFGPDSPENDRAIARVDSAVGAVVDGIAALGLTDRVNVVIVADHGMTPVDRSRVIVLDDYVDLTTVDVVDWTPVAAIAPKAGDEERVYTALQGKHPHLQVYRKGEVPARWHFNDHPRITPIVAVADEGWVISSRAARSRNEANGWSSGGAHGYDPELRSMGAIFVAAGPGIAQGKVVPPFRNVHVYSLLAELLHLTPAKTDGSLDSVRVILR